MRHRLITWNQSVLSSMHFYKHFTRFFFWRFLNQFNRYTMNYRNKKKYVRGKPKT
jgi:hypothetical protein